MREMGVARKESMFRPVEGEVIVKEVTRKAMTKRGQRKLLLAKDVPNKLVQDRSSPMVIIGSDVESLYPSLDADQVVEIVHDAVNGTRPGVTGAGPMGAESGDQNQWKFRNIELSDLEKRQIVAIVMRIAVRILF